MKTRGVDMVERIQRSSSRRSLNDGSTGLKVAEETPSVPASAISESRQAGEDDLTLNVAYDGGAESRPEGLG